MKWYFVRFEDKDGYRCRPHLIPETLLDVVIQDVIVRHGHIPADATIVETSGMDLPGMMISTRPYEVFNLPGLEFTVPCSDVGLIMYDFRQAKSRDDYWYKVTNYHHCMCLEEDDWASLTAEMALREPSANKKYDKFFAEWSAKTKPRGDV